MKMKGTAIPIYEMFDGSKTKLQIPVYQRNYDWKVPNCQQLFDDLVDMVKEDRDTSVALLKLVEITAANFKLSTVNSA